MSRWARFGPVIGWALLLFLLSSIPGDEFAPIPAPIGTDKLVHVVVYGVLGWLAMRAWARSAISPWLIVLLCVGYGVTDELHQLLVPGRYASVWDGLADSIGAALGVWLRYRVQQQQRPERS